MAAGNHTESLNFIHGRFVCGVSNDNDLLGWAILAFLSAITISCGRSVLLISPALANDHLEGHNIDDTGFAIASRLI